MNRVMTLAVFDENAYFAKGLLKALMAYFDELGVETRSVDIQQACEADLVFQYLPPASMSCFCHFSVQERARNPLYFTLSRPENRRKRNQHPPCVQESGVIYHDMSVAAMLREVTIALEQRQTKTPVRYSSEEPCICQQHLLTQREHQILVCMKDEMGMTEIAEMLHISIKTVSHHKMNVMRKMGFQRNTELYGWLRQEVSMSQKNTFMM